MRILEGPEEGRRPTSLARRGRMGCSLAVLLAGLVLAATAGEGRLALAAQSSEFRLDNGLRVVVIPDHRVPVVTHMVWYAVGSKDEAPHEHAVAHYLEHMMFKGTAKYPKGEFDRYVARRGGQQNARTWATGTMYWQRVPKSALPELMAMEADRMVNLRIDDADVASERAVVLEELRRQDVGVATELGRGMRKALYGDYPEGRDVIGSEMAIISLNGAKAQGFYKRFYGPERAFLLLAGDVTEEEARRLAATTYAAVPARGDLAPLVTAEAPEMGVAKRLEVAHERATAVQVERMYLAPGLQSMGRREQYAANLFAYAAGSGMTSRLHRRLINEAALATHAGCSYSVGARFSTLSCSATGKVGIEAPALERAFVKSLDELAAGGLEEEEFQEVKSRFLATGPFRDDNVFDRADTYGSLISEGMSIADVESLESDIADMTRAEVEVVARRILREARNVTGVLVPKPEAAADATTAN